LDANVQDFLDAHPSHCEVRDDWPLQPEAPLLARLCLASSLPPPACRSSILGIVTRPGGKVLFIDPARPSGTIAHVLIGGRPTPGETPEETLRREVGEESGWRVQPTAIVGFRHFHHLGPPHPQLADRPYLDFVEPVYAAIGQEFDPTLLLEGEGPFELVDAEWAIRVTEARQRPLLHAALRASAP
jgi:8-oxo-dGTP pyrophosphatase MutT (NUDIX family)